MSKKKKKIPTKKPTWLGQAAIDLIVGLLLILISKQIG